jgi:hypothetical protein
MRDVDLPRFSLLCETSAHSASLRYLFSFFRTKRAEPESAKIELFP